MLHTTDIPIVVRPAAAHDLDVLCELIHAAYAEYAGRLIPPSGAHKETTASLAAKLAVGAGAIAWRDGVPLGSVLFEPRGEALYLGRLAVPPLHRRQGIGARLVRYVEAQAVARGHTHVTLGVRLQLPENTAFYTQLGYHIAGYGAHPGFDAPTYMPMVKYLQP